MTDIRTTIKIIKSRNDADKIISNITKQLDDHSSNLRKIMRAISKQQKLPFLVIVKRPNCLFFWRSKAWYNIYYYQREYIINRLESIYHEYEFFFQDYGISIIW